MSKITTLGIGGEAKDFQVVRTPQELLELIKNNPDFLIIGGGSNLLVSDEGVNCLVIKNEITDISHLGGVIKVKGGTTLQNLVDYSVNHGLPGLQKLSGIPGTVGGAVYGNAGAYGQTISDHIASVQVLDSSNLAIQQFNNTDCKFSYRDSNFKRNKFIILEITFQLKSAAPKNLKQEAKDVFSKRLVKYPPGIKCPGSFFKNLIAAEIPPEILKNIPQDKIVYGKLPAGALLEMVGAKGKSLGGIKIAPYHANLFINQGNGTAKDFYNLAKKYAKLVKEKFGITLEPEVQLINLPPLI